MKLLKVENLNPFFESLNSYEAGEELLEDSNLAGLDVESYYNEKDGRAKFFKRFTIELDDTADYETFIEKIKMFAQSQIRIFLTEQNNILEAEDSSVSYEDSSASYERINKEIKKMEALKNITLKEYQSKKMSDGRKLFKFLKQCKVPQSIIDGETTKERKAGEIVQLTFNPTAQAQIGASGYARMGSWDGYCGTSCLDPRHGGENIQSLVALLQNKRAYIAQLNYARDNAGLAEYADDNELTLAEAVKSYDIEEYMDEDILTYNNMEDNLKARKIMLGWAFNELLFDGFLYGDEPTDQEREAGEQIHEAIKVTQSLGGEFYFLKGVKSYGNNKTKQELKNIISGLDNLLINAGLEAVDVLN